MNNIEDDFLALIQSMQTELSSALASLAGKKGNPIELYQHYVCRGIAENVEGYLILRRAGKDSSSRVLVRTCLEAVFRITAINKEPEILYQIAHSEWDEDRKFLQAAKDAGNNVDLDGWNEKWAKKKPTFVALFPGEALKENFINAYDLAKTGGWSKVYAFQYRLYCNFTHASLRAIFSWPHTLPNLDNATVGACVLAALESVQLLGGKVPSFTEFVTRLRELTDLTAAAEEK